MPCILRPAAIGALLITAASPALSAQDVSHCVPIQDPEERLNCFDDAFVETTEVPASEESPWEFSSDTSALDDSTNVYLSTPSLEPVADRYGQTVYPQLWVRCLENTTSVFINFGGLHMTDHQSYGMVSYRVDDRTASKIPMDASTNNMALGLWRGGNAIKFIKTIMDGDQLFVRATPYSSSPVEVEFAVAGLDEKIGPLREACHW